MCSTSLAGPEPCYPPQNKQAHGGSIPLGFKSAKSLGTNTKDALKQHMYIIDLIAIVIGIVNTGRSLINND